MAVNLNINTCRCCGKERSIFKDGFCEACYKYRIQKKYILNPKGKTVKSDTPFALLNEINEKGTDIQVKELSEKYGISKTRIYQLLNKYFDVVYVKRENDTEFTLRDFEINLNVRYDEDTDSIVFTDNKKNKITIRASELIQALKKETM